MSTVGQLMASLKLKWKKENILGKSACGENIRLIIIIQIAEILQQTVSACCFKAVISLSKGLVGVITPCVVCVLVDGGLKIPISDFPERIFDEMRTGTWVTFKNDSQLEFHKLNAGGFISADWQLDWLVISVPSKVKQTKQQEVQFLYMLPVALKNKIK